MMKRSTLMMLLMVTTLILPTWCALAAINKGEMTLSLTGEIDMNINPSQVQYINGTLSGTTNFSHRPVYSNYIQKSWNPSFALIALSSNTSRCNAQALTPIPGQSNKYGLKLTHNTNTNATAYVIPEINYSVMLKDFPPNYQPFYLGKFFHVNGGVIDDFTKKNICYVPSNYATASVPANGMKDITITSPGLLPIYIDNNLTPGKLTYRGQPLYISSYGTYNDADSFVTVNIIANITVKRSCAVTGISNQQINENMTSTNEVVRDSLFTLSCGGLGNPVNISATVKEGSLDKSNINKLVLAPIKGTTSTQRPWVIGLPYKQTSTPNLTCADENNNHLIRFNNTAIELAGTNMGNNQPALFGIKWALCKPKGTKAGEYRGKVDVNFFVRG
ncbi:TPA: hypothetical protein SMM66_003550 [Proteus mirabilis]|nr:hypothetical protein [Proteus mirabilis]